VPYAGSTGPLLLLQLAVGALNIFVAAVVDSGAARSMLPMEIAKRLGIADALVRDQMGARGVEGGGFPTWSYPDGVEAHVMRIGPRSPHEITKWGSPFTLNPAFCEKDPFLLGRQDFFARFRVAFVPGNPHPTFSIS
jgi:hypothetical protein